jgi:hypothetical protein
MILSEAKTLLSLVRDCLNGHARLSRDSHYEQMAGILEKLHRDLIYVSVKAELDSIDRN